MTKMNNNELKKVYIKCEEIKNMEIKINSKLKSYLLKKNVIK